MEEFDDLMPTPDDNGDLELTYRASEELDNVVWTMGKELKRLNCAFNRIAYFPPELGDLKLLVELNCSCNKLGTLPPEIGRLRSLRLLKSNGNMMTVLPDELGDCGALEEVVVSENKLSEFPRTVGRLQKLRVLRLQSNFLVTIPCELADVLALEEVNCDNNPTLHDMVPVSLQASTSFIMWLCRHRREHDLEVTRISGVNSELSLAIERAALVERKLASKLQQENGLRSELIANSDKHTSKACSIS